LRADLRCVPIRGNAGTRLGKVSDGELDAVVLAYAGLARIGQVDLAAEQRIAQRADEDAGAADLGQLRPADVAQRGHPEDLDRAAGPLGDYVGHLA